MRELAQQLLAGEEAWVVGGAVRDELLGREVIDLDVACREPRQAARAYAKRSGGAPFPLSERHGAWRVALDAGRTVDFTPLRNGIEDDLATRDFTINAIAEPLDGGEPADPFGGRADLAGRVLRAVSASAFEDDPLRLLRAVRLEDELGFRLDPETEQLVREHAGLVAAPSGERIYAELVRLSADGFRRADQLGLLAPLGGSVERLEAVEPLDSWESRLAAVLGESLLRLPVPNELQRYARTMLRAEPPADDSLRAVHRFRRATEPWALDALAFVGAWPLADAVRAARDAEPEQPLLTGEDILALGVPSGPEVGRLLDLVAEEHAVGTISRPEEAVELVTRSRHD
jgi:Poly A polymerase head domain/Probable RNA and SrmB- binding site of polymerase A